MIADHYSPSRYPVRGDISEAHQKVVLSLSEPGTWWTGAERRAIALEARAARECALCRERKVALSPFSVTGIHDGPKELAPEIIDVVHRIVTDPGRLSRSWYEGVMAEGVLDDAHYVELIAVTVAVTSLDIFARGIDLSLVPLWEASDGAPKRERPATARVEGAWVPQIPAGAEGAGDWSALYGDADEIPQIGRALSLVPDEVRGLQLISAPLYMELEHVTDPRYVTPGRVLDSMQVELIASRVSAINECFYRTTAHASQLRASGGIS